MPEQARAPESSRKASGDVKAGVGQVRTGAKIQPKDSTLKIVPALKSAATAGRREAQRNREQRSRGSDQRDRGRTSNGSKALQAASAAAQSSGAAEAPVACRVPVRRAPCCQHRSSARPPRRPSRLPSDPRGHRTAAGGLRAADRAAAGFRACRGRQHARAPPVAASRPPLPMDPVTAKSPRCSTRCRESAAAAGRRPDPGDPGRPGLHYRLRGHSKDEAGVTPSQSRMQPDSFFGASGGQRVDTRDAAASGSPSSMSYSLSQISAIGDVDPVPRPMSTWPTAATCGRGILRRRCANPERLAIRTKLLEVYAKRRGPRAARCSPAEALRPDRRSGRGLATCPEARSLDRVPNPLYSEPGGPASGRRSGRQPAARAARCQHDAAVGGCRRRRASARRQGWALQAWRVPPPRLRCRTWIWMRSSTPRAVLRRARVAAPAVDEVDLDIAAGADG